jgi:hypothetical protein
MIKDDEEDSDGDNSRARRAAPKDKSVTWPLGLDQDGWPILPAGGDLSTSDLKDIVRSFVTLTYRKEFLSISPLKADWEQVG